MLRVRLLQVALLLLAIAVSWLAWALDTTAHQSPNASIQVRTASDEALLTAAAKRGIGSWLL